MPMQPRPISETSSPALPRFRDLMVPPISRWPASGGRFVRVGHREQVAHGTQPDLPLAQVVASVVVVALDLPVHVDRGDAVLGDEVLLDRSRRVEEDGFRSDVGPEHIVRLGALLRAAVPAARPRPSRLVDPLPGPAALAGPCGVHVHGSSIAVERSGVVTASAHLTFRLAAIFGYPLPGEGPGEQEAQPVERPVQRERGEQAAGAPAELAEGHAREGGAGGGADHREDSAGRTGPDEVGDGGVGVAQAEGGQDVPQPEQQRRADDGHPDATPSRQHGKQHASEGDFFEQRRPEPTWRVPSPRSLHEQPSLRASTSRRPAAARHVSTYACGNSRLFSRLAATRIARTAATSPPFARRSHELLGRLSELYSIPTPLGPRRVAAMASASTATVACRVRVRGSAQGRARSTALPAAVSTQGPGRAVAPLPEADASCMPTSRWSRFPSGSTCRNGSSSLEPSSGANPVTTKPSSPRVANPRPRITASRPSGDSPTPGARAPAAPAAALSPPLGTGGASPAGRSAAGARRRRGVRSGTGTGAIGVRAAASRASQMGRVAHHRAPPGVGSGPCAARTSPRTVTIAVRCHRYTVIAIDPTAMTAVQGRGRASQADTRPRASITRASCQMASATMQMVGGFMFDWSPGSPTMLGGNRPVPVRATRAPRPAWREPGAASAGAAAP